MTVQYIINGTPYRRAKKKREEEKTRYVYEGTPPLHSKPMRHFLPFDILTLSFTHTLICTVCLETERVERVERVTQTARRKRNRGTPLPLLRHGTGWRRQRARKGVAALFRGDCGAHSA